MKFLKERVFLAVFSRTLLDLGLWVGEKRGESLVVLRSAVACSEGTERDRVFFGGGCWQQTVQTDEESDVSLYDWFCTLRGGGWGRGRGKIMAERNE